MEKLIELLNEKEKELSPSIQVEWTEFSVGINKWYLISKECWFIKWLVENDKIDIDKVEEKSEYTFIKNGWWEHIIEDVLMLLAIKDEPIRFLCEILK